MREDRASFSEELDRGGISKFNSIDYLLFVILYGTRQHRKYKSENMAQLKIPSPLRTYASGQSIVEVTGSTVGEAMDSLVEQHPDLRQHLFNGQQDLRPFVNLYLNSEDIRHLQNLDTPIQPDDRLMIVPSIAGGRE